MLIIFHVHINNVWLESWCLHVLTVNCLWRQSGVAGVGVLSKPRAVLLMEEELRAALASFFCHSSPTGLRQAPVTLAHGGTVDATTDKPVLTMASTDLNYEFCDKRAFCVFLCVAV